MFEGFSTDSVLNELVWTLTSSTDEEYRGKVSLLVFQSYTSRLLSFKNCRDFKESLFTGKKSTIFNLWKNVIQGSSEVWIHLIKWMSSKVPISYLPHFPSTGALQRKHCPREKEETRGHSEKKKPKIKDLKKCQPNLTNQNDWVRLLKCHISFSSAEVKDRKL